MLDKILWTLNRLRAMDTKEVSARIRQKARLQAERIGFGLAHRPPPPEVSHFGRSWVAQFPSTIEAAPFCEAADLVMEGHFDVFSLRKTALGFPPCWNQDPKTKIMAPLIYGKAINYRDDKKVGDIKYLWEPNRHLQSTLLAQAYYVSGRECYANGVRVLVDSWLLQCPYAVGPNWTSSLELAIRLINWSFCWHLLGGSKSSIFDSDDGQRFMRRWLDSIYQHCYFISGYFSRFSSANNHLFGELTGLYVASITWPCWQESTGWKELAEHELIAEAHKQTFADGGNREQAIYYHHSVADMMLLCILLARENDTAFPKSFVDVLERMLEFLAALMSIDGAVPMIGDADDALMARWSVDPHWNPYRSLLASGAVLFKRTDFKMKAGLFDEKSRWLLGDAGEAAYTNLDRIPPGRWKGKQIRSFPDAGYYIMADMIDTRDEIRLVIDAGPVGYLAIAAHGHADALSFVLTVHGKDFLIDPGTYAYHTERVWRDYFRGTSAHNTVRVDRRDQSESGGNFMWLRKADARCERWQSTDEYDYFSGSHDGYSRLQDPVIHRREIRFTKQSKSIVVRDTLDCTSLHEAEICWHFSEHCKVSIENGLVVAEQGNVRLEMLASDKTITPELSIGQEDPPFGWVSRSLDYKTPSPSVVFRKTISGRFEVSTSISISILPAEDTIPSFNSSDTGSVA